MIKYPEYERSILSVASSVLKHFGVPDCPHETLPEFDKLLEKNYKNVVVMLFDGLGISALEEHLGENDFLRKNLICPVSSVFPSTTVAATTSITSGLSPLESAWLGWDLYFKEIDKTVAVFRNTEQVSRGKAADYNVADRFIPVKSIFTRIEEINGKGSAYCVSPFSEFHSKSVKHICRTVKRLSKKRKKKYIYTYWHQPDTAMHDFGVKSEQVHEQILEINREVEKLCKKLKNTLVIITADHGQIDGENLYLEDYPELSSLLERPPSVEPRALSFFVKDGKENEFRKEFTRIAGDSFILFTKEEAFSEGLFGKGAMNKKTDEFIGSFFAVATGNKSMFIKREERVFKGIHAGLTEEEMTVPFITVEKRKNYRKGFFRDKKTQI